MFNFYFFIFESRKLSLQSGRKSFLIFVILNKYQGVGIDRKNIKILIVGLIGLMVAAHEIVPHHHHYDSLYSHEEYDPCTSDHDKQEKQQDSSEHCHAFNESIVDWVDYSKISFHPLSQLLEIILVPPEILKHFSNSYFEYHFTCDISPFIHFIFYESLLRAPPVLA